MAVALEKENPVTGSTGYGRWGREDLGKVIGKIAPTWARFHVGDVRPRGTCIHIRIGKNTKHIANSDQMEFSTLASQWQKETAHSSSLSEKISHRAYLRIIKMGESAIPLILIEMKHRPGHWFEALDILTDGASPATGA
jgi:hypothetical protein